MSLAIFDDGRSGIEVNGGASVGNRFLGSKADLAWAVVNEHKELMGVLTEYVGWTDLICAAALGSVNRVVEHLDECRERDINGRTALMWAAMNGHKEVVEVLVESGREMVDDKGHTALYYALKGGCIGVAKVLIPYEDPTDDDGVTALMRAATDGNIEMAELLVSLQKGMKDRDGNTAFMHALKNKHTDVALLLCRHESPSWTPLMCAAFIGDVEVARRHLSSKDEKNSDGDTALVLAARAGHRAVVELIDPIDDKGVTALMRAVNRNDVDAVKALIPIQKGRKTYKEVTISGWYMRKGTALMMAAAHGYAEIVELLVEHEKGEKVGGWSALIFAARCNSSNDHLVDYPRCVELLVEYESNISGWTELIYAAYRGDIDAVRNNLHMRGRQDAGGWTALMYAAARGHERIVELLKEESGMKNNDHQTALMWAARNGHPECVRLLLKEEGGMQATKGWTALMSAAYSNAVECAKLLKENEKDLKTSSSCHGYPPGTTALDIAKKKDHKELVDILSN